MKIRVRVHPNSSKEEIKKVDEFSYEIWLKEKAVDNKANICLMKTLRKHLGKEVRITAGFSSKNKIVEI